MAIEHFGGDLEDSVRAGSLVLAQWLLRLDCVEGE